MIFQKPTRRNLKDRSAYKEKFPKFELAMYSAQLPKNSKAHNMRVRPNTVLIRPYSPEGFTEGGLYVTLNTLWPRVWGLVLACTMFNNNNLMPGDLIFYERWMDRLIDYDDSVSTRFKGEKQPIAMVHESAILAVVERNMIPIPV